MGKDRKKVEKGDIKSQVPPQIFQTIYVKMSLSNEEKLAFFANNGMLPPTNLKF